MAWDLGGSLPRRSIRAATHADVVAIARVHVKAWDAAKEGLELATRRSLEQRVQTWTSYLEEGESPLLVAEVDGAVDGFTAFGPSRDDDGSADIEIYTLYVDPSSWSQGVGSALMSCVPVDQKVSLWVAERNSRAREFYGRRGFTPDGTREAGHHVPVLRLIRPPTPST